MYQYVCSKQYDNYWCPNIKGVLSSEDISLLKKQKWCVKNMLWSRAKTGTEFWNRLYDLWKPNRNWLIVILRSLLGAPN